MALLETENSRPISALSCQRAQMVDGIAESYYARRSFDSFGQSGRRQP